MKQEFNWKVVFVNLLIAAGIGFICPMALAISVGEKAPSFDLKSGDDKALKSSELNNLVLIVFYEHKDTVEKNRNLKDLLRRYLEEQPDKIKKQYQRLSIIDCSAAFWPVSILYKSKMKENSEKEGITVWGDWDGKMFKDYNLKKEDSNFLIINRDGTVKYVASGLVESQALDSIKKLLKDLYVETE